jgi:hypothetical protein
VSWNRGDGEPIRVYLDTGVLADAADRTAPWDDLEPLLSAMSDTDAVLVVSLGHVIDLHRARDTVTREKMLEVVGQFERVMGVGKDILAAERAAVREGAEWEPGTVPPSLTLMPLEDPQRELVSAIAQDAANVVGMAHAADLSGRSAQGAPSKETNTLFERALRAVASGEAISVGDLYGPAANALPREIRAQMEKSLAQLAPQFAKLRQKSQALGERGVTAAEFARQLAKRPAATEFDFDWFDVRGKHEAWLANARQHAPGNYLVWILRRHQEQARRQLDPGDRADRIHAAILPYVDVATLDRENHAVIETHWARISKRTSALVPNGRASPESIAEMVGGLARSDDAGTSGSL